MKLFTRLLALTGLLAAFVMPVAAQPSLYVEGTHYVVLDKPVRTVDPAKIEVTEVFWYGCGHCYAFEPLIENFEASLAGNVVFVRSPANWSRETERHAKVFYTAKALGILEVVHSEIFDEIHQRGGRLLDEGDVQSFFESKAGVSSDDFEAAWGSFGVTSEINRAGTRMNDYGVESVPNMVVNGKYRISSNTSVPTQADVLKVVEFLVQKELSAI